MSAKNHNNKKNNDDNDPAKATNLTQQSGCDLVIPFDELTTPQSIIEFLKKNASHIPCERVQQVINEMKESLCGSTQARDAQNRLMLAMTELKVAQDHEDATEKRVRVARELVASLETAAEASKAVQLRAAEVLEAANESLTSAKALVEQAATALRTAEADLAREQANLEALVTQIADLERTLTKLDAQARANDNELGRATARQSRLALVIAELKEKKAELLHAIEEMKQRRIAAAKAANEAEATANAASDQAVLFEGDRDAARASVAHLKLRAQQIANERERHENTAAAHRAEASQLHQQAAQVRDSTTSVGSGKDKHDVTVSRDNERSQIRARAAALEAEATRLSTRADTLGREHRETLDAMNVAEREANSFNSRLLIERRKVERANIKAGEAHSLTSKLDSDLASANAQNTVLRERASTLQQEHDAAVEDATQLRDRIAELREQNAKWSANRATLQQAVAAAKDNVNVRVDALATARANVVATQNQRDQYAQQATAASKALSDAEASVGNARASVDAATSELSTAHQSTTAHTDRVVAVRKHVDEVEKSAKSIDNRLAAAQAYVNHRLRNEEEQRRKNNNNNAATTAMTN